MHPFIVSAYKEILDKADVKNKLSLFKGVPHAFFGLPGKQSVRNKNNSLVNIFFYYRFDRNFREATNLIINRLSKK